MTPLLFIFLFVPFHVKFVIIWFTQIHTNTQMHTCTLEIQSPVIFDLTVLGLVSAGYGNWTGQSLWQTSVWCPTRFFVHPSKEVWRLEQTSVGQGYGSSVIQKSKEPSCNISNPPARISAPSQAVLPIWFAFICSCSSRVLPLGIHETMCLLPVLWINWSSCVSFPFISTSMLVFYRDMCCVLL